MEYEEERLEILALKVRDFTAQGSALGIRSPLIQALKGRHFRKRHLCRLVSLRSGSLNAAPLGLAFFISPIPRTLPGASLLSPFRAVSPTK